MLTNEIITAALEDDAKALRMLLDLLVQANIDEHLLDGTRETRHAHTSLFALTYKWRELRTHL